MALAFYSCNWESRVFDIIVAVIFASLTNLLFQLELELPTMFSSRAFSAVKLFATLDTKNSLQVARLSLAFGLVRHTSTVTTPSVQVIRKLNDLWAAQFESAILEMRPCPFKFTPQALLSSFYRDCNQDLVVLLDCDCQPEVKISEPSWYNLDAFQAITSRSSLRLSITWILHLISIYAPLSQNTSTLLIWTNWRTNWSRFFAIDTWLVSNCFPPCQWISYNIRVSEILVANRILKLYRICYSPSSSFMMIDSDDSDVKPDEQRDDRGIYRTITGKDSASLYISWGVWNALWFLFLFLF